MHRAGSEAGLARGPPTGVATPPSTHADEHRSPPHRPAPFHGTANGGGGRGAGQGGTSVDPAPGAATEGVSAEADSGSRGGTRRAARRGGAQSFLPNFRCLLPPPARARLQSGGGGGGGGGQRRGAGRSPSGPRRLAVGAGSPVPAPPLEGGGRERAAGEGPAPPQQNEPAVGHRHKHRLGVPAGPAAQLGLPVAAGHAPSQCLRCLPARASRRRRTPGAGLRQGSPGAAGLAPALQLSQQLLPAAARRGGCPARPNSTTPLVPHLAALGHILASRFFLARSPADFALPGLARLGLAPFSFAKRRRGPRGAGSASPPGRAEPDPE